MIKQNIAIIAAAAVLAASLATSQAAFVTGNIGFTGQANLNTASVNTATAVNSWSNTAVNGGSGTFGAIPLNTLATFATPWSFNSGAINTFWTVTANSITYTFNLTSSTITFQGSGFLAVSGVGIVKATGFQDTAMSWSFTAQDPAVSTSGGTNAFTFSASTAAIPEPSTVAAGALLLLPFGISTLRILRKSKNS